MKTRARVATWQRLRQQPTWKLLAADNAPLIAALLQALYRDLRGDRWGVRVRLEQERIGWDVAWGWISSTLPDRHG